MLDAAGDDEHRVLGQCHGAFTLVVAEHDGQFAVEYQEELVGVVVGVPQMLPSDLGDVLDGGQRQFIERPVPAIPDTSLAPVLAWAQERLNQPLTIADLAAHAATSAATLHRRFQAELGTTPLAWLTAERVTLACRLIENGELRLEAVARASGLGTLTNLRTHVRRQTGLTPSAYRARFAPR